MQSLVTALADAFDIDSAQVKPERAAVEIDHFDGWRLSSADYVIIASCGRG